MSIIQKTLYICNDMCATYEEGLTYTAMKEPHSAVVIYPITHRRDLELSTTPNGI